MGSKKTAEKKIPDEHMKWMLAFEYGAVIADVCKEQKVKLTPELMRRAEEMIVIEFQGPVQEISTNMQINLLSIFETNAMVAIKKK